MDTLLYHEATVEDEKSDAIDTVGHMRVTRYKC